MPFIFLIGPPGSGKTSSGNALAQITGRPFYDTDQLIERKEGASVREIFAQQGEAYFRRLECELVDNLDTLCQDGGLIIIGTGGGLPVHNENLQKLSRLGKVVNLSTQVATLVQRLEGDSARPLLSTNDISQPTLLGDRLSQLMMQRSPVYNQAGYKIDTTDLNPEQVAHEILKMIAG